MIAYFLFINWLSIHTMIYHLNEKTTIFRQLLETRNFGKLALRDKENILHNREVEKSH